MQKRGCRGEGGRPRGCYKAALTGVPYAPLLVDGVYYFVGFMVVAPAICTYLLHVHWIIVGALATVGYLMGVAISRCLAALRLRCFQNQAGDSGLAAYGNAEDLMALEDLDQDFHGLYVVQAYADSEPAAKATLVAIFAVFMLTALSIGFLAEQYSDVIPLLMVGAWIGLWFVAKHLFRVYYRVVAQRLDIVRFAPFVGPSERCTSVELSGRSLECDFARRRLTVRGGPDGGDAIVLRLGGVPDVQRFVRGVFCAAIASGCGGSANEREAGA